MIEELSDGCSRLVIRFCGITLLQRNANYIPLELVRILLCPWQVGPTIRVLGASKMGRTSQGCPYVVVITPVDGAVLPDVDSGNLWDLGLIGRMPQEWMFRRLL